MTVHIIVSHQLLVHEKGLSIASPWVKLYSTLLQSKYNWFENKTCWSWAFWEVLHDFNTVIVCCIVTWMMKNHHYLGKQIVKHSNPNILHFIFHFYFGSMVCQPECVFHWQYAIVNGDSFFNMFCLLGNSSEFKILL